MRVSDNRKYICGHRLYACINTRKFKALIRVVRSSQMLAKIAAFLFSISWLLYLAFLYGWHFSNKISRDWLLTLTTQPSTLKPSHNPAQFQANYIIARDQKSGLHGTSFQSLPKINCMLITRPLLNTMKVYNT